MRFLWEGGILLQDLTEIMPNFYPAQAFGKFDKSEIYEAGE